MNDAPKSGFRFTPQAALIVLLTMAALFLPLFGVVWLAQSYFATRAAETEVVTEPAEETPPTNSGLREALERTAEKAMPIEPIAEERALIHVHLSASHVPPALETLQQTVSAKNGTLLELEPGHYLVTAPAGTREEVARKLDVDAGSVSAGAEGIELFEVKFEEAP